MSYHICGGKPLCGEVRIQGSKNGALPLLAAALLIPGRTILHNCPDITDVYAMLTLLKSVGCKIEKQGSTVMVDAQCVQAASCPQKQVEAMRSSVMLLSPMLARCGYFCMNRPGGCAIGKRPIDLHISALERMQVSFAMKEASFAASADVIRGAEITLPFASVGATETIVLAAVPANGRTVIRHAAIEPEIVQLCDFLNAAGASITGAGTERIVVEGLAGKRQLHSVEYTSFADRIVAGTYLFAAAATGGQITLWDAPTEQMESVLSVLERLGCKLKTEKNRIRLCCENRLCPLPYIQTAVYPGFPTDLQSMLTVCLSLADGRSVVEETIFENRFQIVDQLWRMGARILVQEKRLAITGTERLCAAYLTARELRGGAALLLAALAAEGESRLDGYEYIERGYEDIVRDIAMLGGRICRS